MNIIKLLAFLSKIVCKLEKNIINNRLLDYIPYKIVYIIYSQN